MKRLVHFQLMLVLLLVCGQTTIQAKRISQWQAQQQAYSFWGKQMPQKAKAKSKALLPHHALMLTMYLTTMQADSSLSQVMMP